MRIIVESIPASEQRYPTDGDWQFLGNDLVIRVSETRTEIQFYSVAIHEIIEAILCKVSGVSQEEVDEFDMAHLDAEEPGVLPDAPYNLQHEIASSIESDIVEEWIRCKTMSQATDVQQQS